MLCRKGGDNMTDRCYLCGELVPEGRMICPSCSGEITEGRSERELLELVIEPFRKKISSSRKEDKE